MKIKQLIIDHHTALTEQYGRRLLPSHRKALDAMLACRSHCGDVLLHCDDCGRHNSLPLSCGHRSCPQCQNHLSHLWLERQKQKLLPVEYFMVTFTLPKALRAIAWRHQSILYELLFKAAAETIRTIGKNNHGLELAMTAVLHTHKRDKGYHPHVHMIVPGGGVIRSKSGVQWKALNEKFLVNEFAMASVFRGIFLRLFFELSIDLPCGLPKQWVVHINSVGSGEKSLKYLARYLYRGVIGENDISTTTDGQVLCHYRESQTNKRKTMKLAPTDFLWRILQHVLPRGFRRVRDYGFLHANAKLLLQRVQLLLRVSVSRPKPKKTAITCRHCLHPLTIVRVIPKKIPMLFRFYRPPSLVAPPA